MELKPGEQDTEAGVGTVGGKLYRSGRWTPCFPSLLYRFQIKSPFLVYSTSDVVLVIFAALEQRDNSCIVKGSCRCSCRQYSAKRRWAKYDWLGE